MNELNEQHFTEAMERALLLGQIAELMGNHPVLTQNLKLQKQIVKIQELAGALYQDVGQELAAWEASHQYNDRDD